VKDNLPTLNELGKDLLHVSSLQIFLSLAFPFMLTAGFFIFCCSHWWLLAFLCPVLLSFFTYGSISHDLVHRTLKIPKPLNEVLLCAIELLTLRSGHAYRSSHLNHHAKFPSKDDLEGAAAGMTIPQAIMDGITLQYRIWWHAFRVSKVDRRWILGEGIAVLVILTFSMAFIKVSVLPFIYCALVIAGSWVFPLATSLIPHNAGGTSELTKTRLYRGNLIRLVAMDHLYHLEHHLYPQVPHHSWPELARRLDPHFERLGVKTLKFWF
jgi:beta-carotene hydroxylase